MRYEHMEQVRLIGKTKHGKDRIRQHGDVWNIMSGGSSGHRMVLESLHETSSMRMDDGRIWRFQDCRSIDKLDDEDFDWQFI